MAGIYDTITWVGPATVVCDHFNSRYTAFTQAFDIFINTGNYSGLPIPSKNNYLCTADRLAV